MKVSSTISSPKNLMKKNVIPLIVIALVVAVASTGVFYGLIVSRMDGSTSRPPIPRLVSAKALEAGHALEAADFRMDLVADPGVAGPARAEDLAGRALKENIASGVVLTDSMLTPPGGGAAPGGIPEGMRAVTVHISDSTSVVQMLHPGDRVDIQVLIPRVRNGEPDVESRTLLQNATVYQIPTPAQGATPQNGPMQGRNVITLLSTPQDAERLSAGDAGAKLRVVLRNRHDQKIIPLASTSLLNLGSGPRPVVTSNFAPGPVASRPSASPVELEVSLIEVAADQLPELAPDQTSGALAVSRSSAKQGIAAKLDELKRGKKASVLASSRLVAGKSGEFSWKASEQSSLRVRIEPLAPAADGTPNLRIQPEATLPVAGVATTRRTDSSVSLGREQGAIVSGLLPAEQAAQLREKLSPGSQNHAGELLMVIKPVTRN